MIIDPNRSDIDRLWLLDKVDENGLPTGEGLPEGIEDKNDFFSVAISAVEVLESLEGMELLHDLEEILKNQMAHFHDSVLLEISSYLEHNDKAILEKLLAPTTTLGEVLKRGNSELLLEINDGAWAVKGQISIANSVYSFFRNASISGAYSEYEQNHGIPLKGVKDDQIFLRVALWSTLSLLVLACAENDQDVEEARYCLGVARGYKGAYQIVSLQADTPPNNFHAQIGSKGGKARHAKTKKVKDFANILLSELMEQGQYKTANNASKLIAPSVWEYSNNIGANLSEDNFPDTLRKWTYQHQKGET